MRSQRLPLDLSPWGWRLTASSQRVQVLTSICGFHFLAESLGRSGLLNCGLLSVMALLRWIPVKAPTVSIEKYETDRHENGMPIEVDTLLRLAEWDSTFKLSHPGYRCYHQAQTNQLNSFEIKTHPRLSCLELSILTETDRDAVWKRGLL